MKRGAVFAFLFLLVLPLSGVTAADQTVELFYDYYSNSLEEHYIDYSSVKIEVNTINDSTCKYDTDNVSFFNMDGSFDLSAGKLHEKTFTGLGDGVYTFFIKCDTTSLGSEPAEMELVIRVNSLVSAQIVLEDDPPLRAGRTELTLLTSKVVANSPSLTYSFDGVVYNDLPLFGSEKIWRGYLLIPKTLKDAVVSFRFSANDLEGRQGTEITSQSVFVIDTSKPPTVSDIDAVGYVGEIELDWDMKDDDDVVEYKIYRDDEEDVDYNDYYETVDESYFDDDDVTKGKTYFYRVVAVDEAGNEGELSREVYATVLRENTSSRGSSGLSASLIGRVENFIVEVESIIDDVVDIELDLSSRGDKEDRLIEELGFAKDISAAKSELDKLKGDAEKFKLQDLTSVELDDKLEGLGVRLGVIKKKVPENLILVDEDSKETTITEEDIREGLLAVNNSLSEKEIEKSVEETLFFVDQSGMKFESEYYVLEIMYMDGSRKDLSYVSREIFGEIERSEDALFVEIVSRDVASDSEEINFKVGDGREIGEDPVFTFKTDTKKIIYIIDDRISLSRLVDSKFTYVNFYESEASSEDSITGFFLFDSDNLGYGGLGFGVLVLAFLLVYFVFLRKGKISEGGTELDKLIDSLEGSLKSRNIDEAKETYSKARRIYKDLPRKEKGRFHKELEGVHELILGLEIEEEIKKISETKDKSGLEKIDKLYSQLSDESKKKISFAYEKVKKDLEGE